MPVTEDRYEGDRDIEKVMGLVPEFFQRVPDYLLPTEWASFKSLVLPDQTAIPNKIQGDDRPGRLRRYSLPVLRLLPHGGGTAVGATEDEDQGHGLGGEVVALDEPFVSLKAVAVSGLSLVVGGPRFGRDSVC
jgi:hypothetical protein